MAQLSFNHQCLILDTCSVINLYASHYMDAILASIPRSVTVTTYVCEYEALHILAADGSADKEQIHLQPLIDKGLLHPVEPETELEFQDYINFATILGDDGESVTGAIAAHRNWAIGTDDRSAIAFFQRQLPNTQLISSLELIKHWADYSNLSNDEIGTAIRNVRIRGRYQPHSSHTLFAWWQSFFKDFITQ